MEGDVTTDIWTAIGLNHSSTLVYLIWVKKLLCWELLHNLNVVL